MFGSSADFTTTLARSAWDAGVGVISSSGPGRRADNTLIVISGDMAHGFPGGKCNLYDLGRGLADRARAGIRPGRVVDDFAILMTGAEFLEVGASSCPRDARRSLVRADSDKSGLWMPRGLW